jgi:hypothetical protein
MPCALGLLKGRNEWFAVAMAKLCSLGRHACTVACWKERRQALACRWLQPALHKSLGSLLWAICRNYTIYP